MKRTITLLAAGAMALMPAIAGAQAPGQGQYNGQGWIHLNTPQHETGQPGASCELVPNQPGNSANSPGSAFADGGTAGSHYAGEQPQNQRNTASVSQYDVACDRPQH